MTHGERVNRELEENLSMRDNIKNQLCDLFNGYDTYPHINGYDCSGEEGERRVIKVKNSEIYEVD